MEKCKPVLVIAVAISIAIMVAVSVALFATKDLRALFGLAALLIPMYLGIIIAAMIEDDEEKKELALSPVSA